MQVLALAILAVVLSFLGSGTTLAAPDRSVRAEVTPSEGRIVFGWDAPTAVWVTRSGHRMTLQFSRALAADLFVPMARLAPWLTNLTAAARPGQVSLELRDGVRADVPEGVAATTIVVVLRHGSSATTTAATPDREPALTMRSGTHPGFGRLVWESDLPLQPDVHREGDSILVTTRAPLPERSPTQALALSRWITGAAVEGRTLRLRLGPGVVAREERPSAAKLVLDFSVPAPRTAAPVIAPRVPRPLTAATAGTAGAVGEVRAPIAPGLPAKPAVPPTDDPIETPTPDVAPQAGPRVPTPKSAPTGEATVATFRWRKPVPAAVFERADVLWIVFGAPAGELAGSEAPALDAAGLRGLGRLEQRGLTAFRYLRTKREPLHVAGGAAVWHLKRGESANGAGKDQVSLVSRGDGGRLVLATTGQPARLADPEAGDVLSLLLVPEARSRLDAPLGSVSV